LRARTERSVLIPQFFFCPLPRYSGYVVQAEAALQPIADIKIILAAEHEKGAALYARKVLTMPQMLYDAADDIIEAAKQRETETDDEA